MDNQEKNRPVVLVIDDDTANLYLLLHYLDSSGFKTMMAVSGKSGIRILERLLPDLILLDIMMPGMNGFEVCRHIKANERTKDIPVIFMTALSSSFDIIEGFAVGAVDYITKPFQQAEVLARIKTHTTIQRQKIEMKLQNDELRQREEELNRYRHHLEGLVAERTEKLTTAHRQLQETERLYRTFAENFPNGGILLFNQDLRLLLVEGRGWTELNVDKEILEGKTIQEISSPEIHQLIEPFHHDTLSGKQTEVELPLNGSIYKVHHVPIEDENGNVMVGMVMTQNITQQKKTESHLQKAKESAEIANRAKSEFLANMSHELRTPLSGILGYAQLLQRDDVLTEQQQSDIDIIYRCGKHLLTLINDILDQAKIEAGKIELMLDEVKLHPFLSDIIDLFRMRAEQSGILFTYNISHDIPDFISADEKRLRQILINLLGNAVKFTPEGQVYFRVSTVDKSLNFCVPEENQLVKIRFEIEDTGTGIAPEDMDKIFLPFQQVRHKRIVAKGTGLGLPISQQLVELMGGKIHAQSTLERGSIFWMELTFPVGATSRGCPPHGRLSKAEHKKIIGIHGMKPNILLVDEVTESRSMLVNVLSPIGFNVQESANGHDALEKLQTFKADIILVDLIMPVVDGYETVELIRELPDFSDVPIIAISANVFPEDRQKSIEIGCDEFIPKPIDIEHFLQRLAVHLKLTWLYKESVAEIVTPMDSMPLPSLIMPNAKEMDKLLKLAKQGRVKNLRQAIDSLENSDETYKPFVAELRHLLDNFQMRQIRELLKK